MGDPATGRPFSFGMAALYQCYRYAVERDVRTDSLSSDPPLLPSELLPGEFGPRPWAAIRGESYMPTTRPSGVRRLPSCCAVATTIASAQQGAFVMPAEIETFG